MDISDLFAALDTGIDSPERAHSLPSSWAAVRAPLFTTPSDWGPRTQP